MPEVREVILADFQACTGIENVEEAILHLNETNWDLLRAVSRVMPDTQSFQPQNDPNVMLVDDDVNMSEVPPIDTATDMMDVGNNVGHPTASKRSSAALHVVNNHDMPSTSSSSQTYKFNVYYNSETPIVILMSENASVIDLKMKIYKELKVATCRQLLSGWARMKQYENKPFKELKLPYENRMELTLKASEGGLTADEDIDVTEKLNGTYMLNVKYDGTTYNLKYPGTKTILDVKSDLYTCTNVHVRNQVWSGWPPNIDDQTMLALSGISYPEHNLTVRKSSANHSRGEKKQNNEVIQIDSDDDEFEDASESFTVDDEYFVDNMATKRMEPLIPETIPDELLGSITFSEQFSARYGHIHPEFYQGTLEDAIKTACSKPAKERKILAIYMHHDASVLTNVFCAQLLGFESVMQVFEKNFVLWGWDITFESNRTRLQTTVNNNLGSTAAMSLRNIPIDRLPCVVLIMRIRSNTDIYSVVHGNVGVNELLSSLIEAVDVFSEHQRVEVKEEQERAERELVKWEQDQAFRESLEADRAKEEAKRKQAQAETETRQRIESEKAEEEAKREAYRVQVEAGLPDEPSANQADITKIRFRLPNGENIQRRFYAVNSLKVLLDYLIVQGYPSSEFKVISSWPRRDLTALDIHQTLKDLKLCPQETVILEER